jgi:tetratricopeptide (TPR) repeat protein
VGRILAIVLGLPLLLAGGYGLLAAYQADGEAVYQIQSALQGVVKALDGTGVPLDFAVTLEEFLAGPIQRFVIAPLGAVLLLFGVLPRRGKDSEVEGASEAESEAAGVLAVDKRLAKKSEKQAHALAKKGQVADAAELLFSVGVMDKAAEYFIQAGQPVRAAEIRHDQNRFLESAELYMEAGQFESAGAIFSQQEEWAKAADCYLKAGGKSVAAEMFEKAGDFKRAGDCYREVEFLRHAAQCYVKCHVWRAAAECLEDVHRDESSKAGSTDPKKQAELAKLVRQAGKLYQKAGDTEKAQAVLTRGECWVDAAEIALQQDQHGRAAELYLEAGEAEKAAEALRNLGENEAAARILGEFHRDKGDYKQAAEHLAEAGEHLAAGDLYRQLDDFTSAGDCYAKQQEFAQAAEMFRLAGDRKKAGQCYERAERYTEAAECYALAGLNDREAELLEKASDFLGAGEAYHREGVDDDAIRVLQKVDENDEGFARAAALLGDIFQSRGQLSLAVKKLSQAIGGAELTRDSLPMFYSLATVYEANGQVREAVEVYEKILAFDYHYEDVEQRLVRVRDQIQEMGGLDSASHENGTSRGFTQSSQPGRYQIVGELGRGGMGIVYKAKDTVLDRLVAYKVLPDALKENPQALKNFLREAKAAAKLNHPGIVTVYDAGEQDGRYFIAMEYVDGTTLKEILRRRGVISPAGVLHVMVQICEALAYAHDQKVVHRDIKTANTMWTRDKKAKIMDFGLAKVVEEVRNHTTVVSGTPYYMSPEQTLGKNIDHRTDIYSLGVTVFEMATGTVPFREGNIPYHHVHTPPPDVREIRPELPAGLAGIVNRCLQKSPEARFQSTREILAEVKASLTQNAPSE